MFQTVHLHPEQPPILGCAQEPSGFLLIRRVWATVMGPVSLGMASTVLWCDSRGPILEDM